MDTLRITELGPGVRHIYAWLERGPWAVHVVEIEDTRCRPVITARKAGPPLGERARTSALGANAIAAVNADFFMLPEGTPVGAHVRGGRVLAGPGSRPTYGLDAAGRQWSGRALLVGTLIVRADTIGLAQVNRPWDSGPHHPPRDGIALFDHWYGVEAPAAEGRTARVRRLAGSHAGPSAGPGSAGALTGVVVAIHEAGRSVPLDEEHLALEGRGEAAEGWLRRRASGDTVVWTMEVTPEAVSAGPAAEAVGGFPLLVRDGRGVYDEQPGVIESFGEQRHPRTAVGWDTAGARTLWVVVDGRQTGYSDGMSLPELERLFLEIGATHALNLDGGGSTTLVLGGTVANRPSDAEGERAVANALVLEACRSP